MSDPQRSRRHWDKQSAGYDRKMQWMERKLFADTRAWVAAQAHGDTLEVGIGTGLNLPHYPAEVRLTGLELSPGMLALARARTTRRAPRLRPVLADAQAMPFGDATFDCVIATFTLCAVPDDRTVVSEMVRVLRPGGSLLLADHVIAQPRWLRAAQFLVESLTVPTQGEHFRRRPVGHLREAGLTILTQERFHRGLIERVAARKPE